jgi:hypothetical protein
LGESEMISLEKPAQSAIVAAEGLTSQYLSGTEN